MTTEIREIRYDFPFCMFKKKQVINTIIVKKAETKEELIKKRSFLPFMKFIPRHVVDTLYDIVDSEYRVNFESDFAIKYYGQNQMENLSFSKKYGDFVIIKNIKVNYICYNSKLSNHECTKENCNCFDCLQETYSLARIIGKYVDGDYKIMTYYNYEPMNMSLDTKDIRKIKINEIVGVVFFNDIFKRILLIKKIETLPNSIYKSE